MIEEEFYAVIKLVSGEEIISKVSASEEEDRTILILEDPVVMKEIAFRQFGVVAYNVEPWVRLTDESLFFIDMERVLTMTEVKDDDIVKMYKRYLRDKQDISMIGKSAKVGLTTSMGLISKVDEARSLLENIFNNS